MIKKFLSLSLGCCLFFIVACDSDDEPTQPTAGSEGSSQVSQPAITGSQGSSQAKIEKPEFYALLCSRTGRSIDCLKKVRNSSDWQICAQQIQVLASWVDANDQPEYTSPETQAEMAQYNREQITLLGNVVADSNLVASGQMQLETFLQNSTLALIRMLEKLINIAQKEYPQCKTMAGV